MHQMEVSEHAGPTGGNIPTELNSPPQVAIITLYGGEETKELSIR